MNCSIRQAVASDAYEIVTLHKNVWPQEDQLQLDFASSVLSKRHNCSFVAEIADVVVGFVDAFITKDVQQVQRGEVDLLAVHPDYRGQGIAWQLIKTITEHMISDPDIHWCRAFVRPGNLPAEKIFERIGYHAETRVRHLYINTTPPEPSRFSSRAGLSASQPIVPGCIEVETLSYKGLWLEAEINDDFLKAAHNLQDYYNLAVCGAMLDLTLSDQIKTLKRAEYDYVGDFRQWIYRRD